MRLPRKPRVRPRVRTQRSPRLWDSDVASAVFRLMGLHKQDFPRSLGKQFASIMDRLQNQPSPEDLPTAVKDLVEFILMVSESAMNCVTLGESYEDPAWCVKEAKEGRPEPLRHFIQQHKRFDTPLPRVVKDYVSERARQRATKSLRVRRGPKAVHPARRLGIARMVKDCFHAQKNRRADQILRRKKILQEHPTVRFKSSRLSPASLNLACQHIACFVPESWQTVRAMYRQEYC